MVAAGGSGAAVPGEVVEVMVLYPELLEPGISHAQQ